MQAALAVTTEYVGPPVFTYPGYGPPIYASGVLPYVKYADYVSGAVTHRHTL